MNDGSRRPTADAIVPSLLAAVDRLCAESSPDEVTMSEIAEEAGLSTGAAYRYFESKDALIGATLDHMADQLASAMTHSASPAEAIEQLWTALDEHPAFPRIVTWLILQGRDVSKIMTRHPVLRDVTQSASAIGASDPETVAGLTAMMGLAGSVHARAVNRALGRNTDDRRLHEAAAAMLAAWISGQAENSSDA